MVIWLASCAEPERLPVEADEPVVDTAEAPEEAVEELDALDLAIRASLDLRGIRPSLDELEAVEADPAMVDELIVTWLDDERFADRVVDLYSEIWLTRLDDWYVDADDYGLDDEPGWARSVGEEPLRMLARIAAEDLPYTDLVTADWTMANEVLAAAWPLDYPEGEVGWHEARYTDGRPVAGVLASNALYWRYMSTTSNANRGRANAISRILLCHDYLTMPVEFERNVNLLDGDAVEEALRSNPGCVGCHASLDPIASYLWGFFYYDYDSYLDTTSYHPERELLYESYTETPPGWYGQPGYDLTDLGWQIAADSRYPECAVEQVFGLLLQRDTELDDTDRLEVHRQAFLDADLRLKPLFQSVLADPRYRAPRDSSDPLDASRKMLSPYQLASSIEDLTGYRFTYADYDMLSTDTYGLRTLAGGVDGYFVTAPASEPTATLVLVAERLAEAAAAYVVDEDRLAPDEPTLFGHVTFSESPDAGREAMVEQLQHLHWRLLGDRIAADGPEVEANLALWQDLRDTGASSHEAWAGVLSVLLRDPEFLFY